MGRLLVALLALTPLAAAAESFEMTVLRGSTVARVHVSEDGVVREETLWEAPRLEPPPAAPTPTTREARPDDGEPIVIVTPVPILVPTGGYLPLFLNRGHPAKLRGHPHAPSHGRRSRVSRISTRRP